MIAEFSSWIWMWVYLGSTLFYFSSQEKKKKKKEPCFSGEKIRNAAFSTQTAIFG